MPTFDVASIVEELAPLRQPPSVVAQAVVAHALTPSVSPEGSPAPIKKPAPQADSRPTTPITEMMVRESDDEDNEKDAVVFVRPSFIASSSRMTA